MSTYRKPISLELIQEGTDDSESGSPPSATVAMDDDDAESCSDSATGGEVEVGGGSQQSEEEEWNSWKSWLLECRRMKMQQEVVVRPHGGEHAVGVNSGGVGLSIVDLESDKLFWEACLAHGYGIY